MMKYRGNKWTDKSVARHKHDFCIRAVCRLRNGTGAFTFYNVVKCSKCNSFHCIPTDKSAAGFIDESGVDPSLPMICLKRSHKYLIGFNGAILEEDE